MLGQSGEVDEFTEKLVRGAAGTTQKAQMYGTPMGPRSLAIPELLGEARSCLVV